MPRPRKCRRVGFIPQTQYFLPAGAGGEMEEVLLTIEEVEALRLADREELGQGICAEQMNVSRGTFQRIVRSARQKTADALVNGKAIHIAGGDYVKVVTSRCSHCHCMWNDSRQICPKCHRSTV